MPRASFVHAEAPPPRGVVVVALPGATDAAWPVARGLYGKAGLLPGALADDEARVLAGEPPPEGASPRLKELARLREESGKEPTRRAALTALSREARARGAVVVGAASGITITRTFNAETGALGDALTFPSDNLDIDKIARDVDQRTKTKSKPSSLVSSPWLWIAAGAAAVLGTVLYISTRGDDPPSGVPLRLRTDR